MKDKGFCPKCHNVIVLEGHHVYPIRFFGKKNGDCKLFICKKCHEEIEAILPKKTRLSKEVYRDIHRAWIFGKDPTVFLP